MVHSRACALLAGLSLGAVALAAEARAEVCPVKTPGFAVELTPMAYTVLFEGKPVHVIFGNDLFHTIFGGKSPYVDCAVIQSTPCFFAIIVGWKLDNLLGFGPVYGQGGDLALNLMRWFPRDETFGPVEAAGRELQITFGRERDLHMRICWNPDGDGKWRFSSNYRDVPAALPCGPENPPGGASQIVWPTGTKAPPSDACTPPLSFREPGRRAPA
jgi:hypothetical protein